VTASDLKKWSVGKELLNSWGITSSPSEISTLAIREPQWNLVHSCWALNVAEREEKGKGEQVGPALRQVGRTLIETLKSLPELESGFLDKLEQSFRHLPESMEGLALPLSPLQKVALTIHSIEQREIPVEKRPTSPFAAVFPGELPAGVQPATSIVQLDMTVPFWHSTGLYAAPGKPVSITAPADAVGKDLKVIVGPHQFTPSSLDDWRRAPSVSAEWVIDSKSMTISNPFGGMIYIAVPVSRKGKLYYEPPYSAFQMSRPKGKTLEIKIEKAFQTAVYTDGKSNGKDFVRDVKDLKAPFAELHSDDLILTIPLEHARAIDDPAAVLAYWKAVLGSCKKAAGMNPSRKPVFPLRIIVDNISERPDINYPVHWPEANASTLTDTLDVGDDTGYVSVMNVLAGYYAHRMTRITGNEKIAGMLMSMYLYNEKSKQSHRKVHANFSKAREAGYIRKILNNRERLGKADIYGHMVPYNILIDQFGWKPILEVFAHYNTLSKSKLPKTRGEINHDFIYRLSRKVDKNLYPFFQIWGFKTSGKVSSRVKSKAPWLPAGFPDRYISIR